MKRVLSLILALGLLLTCASFPAFAAVETTATITEGRFTTNTSSSAYNSNLGATFDNDETIVWSAKPENLWTSGYRRLEWDFDKPYTITGFKIIWAEAASNSILPTKFSLGFSNNNSTSYKRIYPNNTVISSPSFTDGTFVLEDTFTDGVSTRYTTDTATGYSLEDVTGVRLMINEWTGEGYPAIKEVYFYVEEVAEAQTAPYTVKYLVQDTEEQLDIVTGEVEVGTTFTPEIKTFSGYNCITAQFSQEVTGTDAIVVTYYYEKSATVLVPITGGQVLGGTDKDTVGGGGWTADMTGDNYNLTWDGNESTTYTTTDWVTAGTSGDVYVRFEWSFAPSNLTGYKIVFNKNGILPTQYNFFTYHGETRTRIFDANLTIAPTLTEDGNYYYIEGTFDAETAALYSECNLTDATGIRFNCSGWSAAGNPQIAEVYLYAEKKPSASYTVTYQVQGTDTVLDTVTGEVEVGTTFEPEIKTFEGYKCVTAQISQQVTTTDAINVTYYYTASEFAPYEVHYLVEGTAQQVSTVTYGDVEVGTTFAPVPKKVGGYKFVGELYSAVVESTDKIVVKYYYTVDESVEIPITSTFADTNVANMRFTYDSYLGTDYTSWSSTNEWTTRWFDWNFDNAYDLTEMNIVWATADCEGVIEGAPKNYTIFATYDGEAWFEVKAVTGSTATAIGSEYEGTQNLVCVTDTFDEPVEKVRGVRICGTKWASGSNVAAITDVSFRGTVSETPISSDRFYPNEVKMNTSPVTVTQGTNVMANAYDKDVTTAYSADQYTVTSANNVVFTFALPNPTAVDSISFIPAQYAFTSYECIAEWYAYKVEVSPDGTNFYEAASSTTTVKSARSSAVSGVYLQRAAVFSTFNEGVDMERVKYVRLTITDGKNCPGIAEMYVTGDDIITVGTDGYMATLGANIRPADASIGITDGMRFGTEMSRSDYDATLEGTTMTGMLLMPTEVMKEVNPSVSTLTDFATAYLESKGTNLKAFIESYDTKAVGDVTFLPIPAKKFLASESNEKIAVFTAVLVDIPTDEYTTKICAVPYYIDENGNVTFGDEVEKSLYEGALAAKNDDRLTDAQKASVQAILDEVYRQQNTLPLSRVAIDGVSIQDYTVVIPQNADLSTQYAAENLSNWFYSNAGFSLNIVNDSTAETDYEILIGDTNRGESNVGLSPDAAKMEYVLVKNGTKIVCQGDSIMVGGGVGALLQHIPLDGEEAEVNITTLPTTATVSTFEFTEARNAILMIGDGMGYNHIELYEDTTGETFLAKLLPNQGSQITDYLFGATYGAPTDSAAAATALATGFKTEATYIGKDVNGKDLKNIRELANEAGARTAVVTNDEENGATPGGFLAHTISRDDRSEISATIDSLLANGDLTHLSAGGGGTDMAIRSAEALKVISKANSQFFIMMEEAAIDWNSHTGTTDVVVEHVGAMNDAVAYVIQFVLCHPDTALIITADHETGGLTYDEETATYSWTSGTHTRANVPVYAFGYGTEFFNGITVDNTIIPQFMARCYGATTFGNGNYDAMVTKAEDIAA